MIYTIGHRETYLSAIAESPDGVLLKSGKILPCAESPNGYSGGYAFQSVSDAERRINERYALDGYTIFGLKADWKIDTEKNHAGEWWHNLINDSEIVVI